MSSHAISAILESSMCCDKTETIRVLSMYLRETQAQYNDCLSEAAGQGTLMELQRDAVQQLQEMIVRKDLVYYSLLIKAQDLCRGHLQDVRIVKSKMDALIRSKMYLEDKYRRIKRLWKQAERQLREIKCGTLCESTVQQECQFVDCSTCTDDIEFAENNEMEIKLNLLMSENEDLKNQLHGRSRIELEVFEGESRNRINENERVQEFTRETNERLRENEIRLTAETNKLELVLRQHLSYVRILITELQYARERQLLRTDSTTSASQTNIDAGTIKSELYRRNIELDKLIAEARDKEQELGILQDMRKEFERTEGLERINECLKKELLSLRQAAENNECCMAVKLRIVRRLQDDEVDEQTCVCDEGERPRKREVEVIEQLKDQLSTTRQLTEECLIELRASKEMFSSLRDKILSFKRLLKKKSDDLAKLQADHQMIKNDYSILKTENGTFEEKARAELREFRDKLKALQSELRRVGDDYQRLSKDFDKSQELLIEASRRELDLQHAITAMEQIFNAKLSSAEDECKCLSNLVDMLRCELENSRDEFAKREDDFTERYRDACEQVENLEKKMGMLEDAKQRLSRQLRDSRLENYSLVEENARLTEGGCRCVRELEDTHKALLELKGECRAKSQSLDSVSAELMSVATSRTELCEESRHVVCCIRVWMDEQRRLVETLSKRLKNEKNRNAQLTFEKKGLVATVRQLMRLNGTLGELSTRRKKRGIFSGYVKNRRSSKSSYCETSPMFYCTNRRGMSQRSRTSDTASGTTVCRRPIKKRCACLRRTASRQTTLRDDNSLWFTKLERASKQLCDKSRRHVEKIHDGWQSETGMDEARDFGYQSSASK